MNLLFCINGGYISPLLDCLSSIVLHGGEAHYDAYLLSSDLSEEARQTLMQQAPDAVTLHFIAVPRELFDGFPETERYPQEIYYRLAAPLLLPPELLPPVPELLPVPMLELVPVLLQPEPVLPVSVPVRMPEEPVLPELLHHYDQEICMLLIFLLQLRISFH